MNKCDECENPIFEDVKRHDSFSRILCAECKKEAYKNSRADIENLFRLKNVKGR